MIFPSENVCVDSSWKVHALDIDTCGCVVIVGCEALVQDPCEIVFSEWAGIVINEHLELSLGDH